MNEKMKKVIIILIVIFVILLGIILLVIRKDKNNNKIKGSTVNEINIEMDTDDGDEKIDWSIYENEKIDLTENIEITKGGIYTLSGSIEGYVKVKTTEDVKLILDNVNIKNSNGPAIYIEDTENIVIVLKEDTINVIEDGNNYLEYEEDVNGCLYSKSDLVFEGTGTLKVIANYGDGIVSKDDLKIIEGSYEINAQDDGIRGKDSVYIMNGDFNIKALGDGIKSTNDTDTTKGFIKISQGTFNIEASLDGIQAETKLLISNGEFNIKTNEGSSNSSDKAEWGEFGDKRNPMNNVESDTTSAKGIKAGDNLVIENGKFNINSSDDAIHSNNYVGIKEGNIVISSGDDGIHADTEVIIDNGTIDIQKSYEGLEASKITINNGNISLVAGDDGINVASGNDGSSMNRPGANTYNDDVDRILIINDGNIVVNATGDGIDINGSGYIYGGKIIVNGPSDNGNGVLDYDKEFIVNGGLLVAAGSNGMLQGVSESSKQYNVTISLNNNVSGTLVIVDSKNNEIINYSSDKIFSAVVISSEKFKKGETYTIKINDSNYESFKISSITTNIGNIKGMGMGKKDGAMNDRRSGKR